MNIDILSAEQLEQLQDLLAQAQNILVCCHKSPDGDALGSSLAWSAYLRGLGKQVTVAVPDAFPDFLRWQPDVEKIIRYDRHPEEIDKALKEANLICCLDFNAPERLDSMQEAFEKSTAKRILFDHHLEPQLDAVVSVSRPELSSTSEIVFRVLWQLGEFEKMDKKIASTIYSGMMCDTGGFTYNSSRPEIFFIICQLLTKGIDKDKIYRKVFNNYSQWAIRLRGYLMSQKLNYLEDYHASYYTLTRDDMRNFHYVRGDQEGLVNEPLRIKGAKLSISLREDDRHDNTVWVSLRSVDDFPCNEMAARFFNGGGHLNASGGHLNCSMEEAENITRQAIIAYGDLLKKK